MMFRSSEPSFIYSALMQSTSMQLYEHMEHAQAGQPLWEKMFSDHSYRKVATCYSCDCENATEPLLLEAKLKCVSFLKNNNCTKKCLIPALKGLTRYLTYQRSFSFIHTHVLKITAHKIRFPHQRSPHYCSDIKQSDVNFMPH